VGRHAMACMALRIEQSESQRSRLDKRSSYRVRVDAITVVCISIIGAVVSDTFTDLGYKAFL